jgi:hypothetical protein
VAEPSFEQDRVVIESGIVAIAALFAIAQLGRTCESVSAMVPTLSVASFFFIAAALSGTCRKMMAPWPPFVDRPLEFFEVLFFILGLASMAILFYSLSWTPIGNVIPVMLGVIAGTYAVLSISRWAWRKRTRSKQRGTV